MDDDAMFKLDEKLTAAFRSLRKGSKLDKDKAVQLKHYRMRQITFRCSVVIVIYSRNYY